MNKVLCDIGLVYLTGYAICVLITTPLIIWAVHEDEREEGIYREPGSFGLLGKAVLTSIMLSLGWCLLFPLYILMLAEKIEDKEGKNNGGN